MYRFDDIEPYQVLLCDLNKTFATVSRQGYKIKQFSLGGPYYFEGGWDKPFYVGEIWAMAGGGNMQGQGYLTDPFIRRSLKQPVRHGNAILYDSSERWLKFEKDPSHELAKSPRAVYHRYTGATVHHSHALNFLGASLAPEFVNVCKESFKKHAIALIPCAQEGSTSEDWEVTSKNECNSLYGVMLDRIRKIGGRITGVLWYQGESDAKHSALAESYGVFLQNWISKLRNDLNEPKLPLAFVQIGSHDLESPEIRENWKKMQDAQFKLFEHSSYIAGVASLDAGLDSSCHLSAVGLSLVGRRLAYAADKALKGQGSSATPLPSYGFRKRFVQHDEPDILDIVIVCLEFKYLDSPWKIEPGQPINGFSYGESEIPILRAFVADIETGTVRLYVHVEVDKKLTINYGTQPGQANLVTEDGRALPAFRNFPV
ncbi:hypothetical protein A0J61_10146 [Choanephora cucurbitarum]|uniref:Sialate O-acetylesterase domain-containing protein n=1 Tax=Choanephora cucurbitarum TaxID=101091 RepID=A0A1C7N385_9FUNG|nr:hypothetical protein A0J61_10146 [Choanephora cucurbitarum]